MKKTLYPRYCPNLLCQPEANLKAENERLKETAKIAIQEIGAWSRKAGKLEAENERLKAWILKIKEYARSISVIVVRYCEDALKEASSVKENQE